MLQTGKLLQCSALFKHSCRDVWYEEVGSVGILHFPIYNGAASTDQLVRLREAYTYARSKASTRVIMLAGGGYCWSNGIHLNVIEASNDPGQEVGTGSSMGLPVRPVIGPYVTIWPNRHPNAPSTEQFTGRQHVHTAIYWPRWQAVEQHSCITL